VEVEGDLDTAAKLLGFEIERDANLKRPFDVKIHLRD
jgi:hypothetical protein